MSIQIWRRILGYQQLMQNLLSKQIAVLLKD